MKLVIHACGLVVKGCKFCSTFTYSVEWLTVQILLKWNFYRYTFDQQCSFSAGFNPNDLKGYRNGS